MKGKRKVISCKEGYTFFIDDKGVIFFETGKYMTGQDIADILNVSKVAVSQNLKKALRKIYKRIKLRNRELSPVEVLALICEILDLRSEVQYKKLYRLFNEDIKREVINDAYRYRNR